MSLENLLGGLPGFRDFYPEIWEEISFVLEKMKTVCERYNYVEYEGPSLEPIELFEAKSGEGLIGEVFHVKDINGRNLVLRPEQTPTLARMLAKDQQRYQKPIRWYSIPRLFRDETPQKGRLREFWQLNADILGEDSILADVEVLSLAIDIVRECGLEDHEFNVFVNNRKLFSTLLGNLGLEEKAIQIIQLIDRKEKFMQEFVERELSKSMEISRAKELGMAFRRLLVAKGAFLEKLKSEVPEEVMQFYERRDEIEKSQFFEQLEVLGLNKDQMEQIINLTSFSCPSSSFSEEIKKKDIPDFLEPIIDEFKMFNKYIKAAGVSEPVVFDFGLARGLDYYTGFVFEAFDSTGEIVRAIFGGGRYEDLVSIIGGEPLTGVGFGMGDAVLIEIMKSKGKITRRKKAEVDIYISPLKPGQVSSALSVAAKLRKEYRVLCNPFKWKLKKHLEIADNVGARFALIIGPKDIEQGVYSLRDMVTKETRQIPQNALEKELKSLFD
ncbi:MAG: histidine--tRNA ligase [Methanobacteriota archaeon]|nr:MAG: histidine--tRNA ligase [Euryarchaeota archaeon]